MKVDFDFSSGLVSEEKILENIDNDGQMEDEAGYTISSRMSLWIQLRWTEKYGHLFNIKKM